MSFSAQNLKKSESILIFLGIYIRNINSFSQNISNNLHPARQAYWRVFTLLARVHTGENHNFSKIDSYPQKFFPFNFWKKRIWLVIFLSLRYSMDKKAPRDYNSLSHMTQNRLLLVPSLCILLLDLMNEN